MLKAKILFVGPCERELSSFPEPMPAGSQLPLGSSARRPDTSGLCGHRHSICTDPHTAVRVFNSSTERQRQSGKTVLANFLTESSDITEYNPTQGVRILEFENPHVTSNNKGTGCEFELWDCGGDSKFESCWPALMKDAHGVVIVFNADIPSHLKEIEMWYSCFVQQQFLQDSHCMLVAHHKPGSGGERGSLALSPPLNKLKLVHSNLEEDPEEVRVEFIKYLKSIINSMSESRDREEMLIIT